MRMRCARATARGMRRESRATHRLAGRSRRDGGAHRARGRPGDIGAAVAGRLGVVLARAAARAAAAARCAGVVGTHCWAHPAARAVRHRLHSRSGQPFAAGRERRRGASRHTIIGAAGSRRHAGCGERDRGNCGDPSCSISLRRARGDLPAAAHRLRTVERWSLFGTVRGSAAARAVHCAVAQRSHFRSNGTPRAAAA